MVFDFTSAIRGYGISTDFAAQLLLSNVTWKEAFGHTNTFISMVLLLAFLATSATTRQLVQELEAFGLT